MNGKYLITTDAWFYAPDGKQYKSVWGEVKIVDDRIIGVKTNSRSTNWYARVGTEENHLVIAGCQIHYACRCENEPNIDYTDDYILHEGEIKEYKRPTNIYIIK